MNISDVKRCLFRFKRKMIHKGNITQVANPIGAPIVSILKWSLLKHLNLVSSAHTSTRLLSSPGTSLTSMQYRSRANLFAVLIKYTKSRANIEMIVRLMKSSLCILLTDATPSQKMQNTIHANTGTYIGTTIDRRVRVSRFSPKRQSSDDTLP